MEVYSRSQSKKKQIIFGGSENGGCGVKITASLFPAMFFFVRSSFAGMVIAFCFGFFLT